MSVYRRSAVLVLSAALVLTACGNAEPPAPPATTPHGHVDGAEEAAEAQSRLVLADAETGAVRVLDLLTEKTTRLDDVPGVRAVHTDGRFAYLVTDESTRVIDSGGWSVDHGDHVHYYRARARPAGEVDGRAVAVHTDSAVTAVAREDGTTVLLDRAALEDGRTEPSRSVDGIAVPYEQHLVLATDEGVSVRTRDGEPSATIDAPCPGPGATAVTRRGVVFGCADGALLVRVDDGEFHGERIAHPRGFSGFAPRAAFRHRPGSATLTAPAERGVWSLDLARRQATLVETGPVVAVNAVGAGGPVLTLTADGVLHAYDSATGERVASRSLLPDGVAEGAAAPVIEVDTSRAYVNDPAGRRVHEIDYNDELRVARTVELDITPSHVVETGR